jgi:ketosteroid isomerase-like protein
MKLPEPIAAYFAAVNVHDIEATLAPFAETATVKDEGQERRGAAAIREWIEDTTRKYRVTVVVTEVNEADGKTVVTGQVSGNFPGSPVQLHYNFTLDGEKIARLEILA